MSNDLATNLIRLRSDKNLTQQELGDAIGVSASQISRYEAGQAMPRKTMLIKLAAALGVTEEELNPEPKKARIKAKNAENLDKAVDYALDNVAPAELAKVNREAQERGITPHQRMKERIKENWPIIQASMKETDPEWASIWILLGYALLDIHPDDPRYKK